VMPLKHEPVKHKPSALKYWELRLVWSSVIDWILDINVRYNTLIVSLNASVSKLA